jgi:hypothetical protein
MNTVLYYLNLTLMPLLFVVILVKNVYNLTKQAFRWSVSETMNAYRSNRRVFKKD